MDQSHESSTEWQQAWARLLALRQHLPENYEIQKRFVDEYHELVKTFANLTGADLSMFAVPEDEIRPKVVSVSMATRHRLGKVNYSDDNYCQRTTLLMKMDALIPFLKSTACSRPLESGEYTFHPEVERVSGALYRDGHNKQAAFEAYIRVIDEVKTRTALSLDGDALMNQAFGCDRGPPVLQFNDLQTQAEKDEQKGFLFLYKGIVGLRNTNAHSNQAVDSPERCFEYLALASLLLRILDTTRRSDPPQPS